MTHDIWLAWVVIAIFALHWATVLWLEARQRAHVLRNQSQVPTAFQNEVSLAEHQAAARYALSKSVFTSWTTTASLIEAVCWTFGGGLSWLQSTVSHGLGDGLTAQLTFVAAFILIHSLIQLPFSLYSTFVVEAEHGFNRSSLSLWFIDQIKGLLLGLILGLALLAGVLQLMSQGGTHWWIWVWLLWMSFQIVLMIVAPRWLMPLFNTFKPFEDEHIRPRAEALMQAVGFKAKDFQVMDASRRSSHANAFFTGLGTEKRVVFFDTLLDKLNAGEVIAVLAHELGHFKLRHVTWMFITQALVSAVFLFGLDALQSRMEVLSVLGLEAASGQGRHALLLLSLYWLLPPALFFLKPLGSALSRRREFQADAFAVQHAQAPDLRNALIKLYKGNSSTLTPDPLYVWFHHSHPPALDRLRQLHV